MKPSVSSGAKKGAEVLNLAVYLFFEYDDMSVI